MVTGRIPGDLWVLIDRDFRLSFERRSWELLHAKRKSLSFYDCDSLLFFYNCVTLFFRSVLCFISKKYLGSLTTMKCTWFIISVFFSVWTFLSTLCPDHTENYFSEERTTLTSLILLYSMKKVIDNIYFTSSQSQTLFTFSLYVFISLSLSLVFRFNSCSPYFFSCNYVCL